MVTVANTTPPRLILMLAVYFLILITAMVLVVTLHTEALRFLPLGGHDAFEGSILEITQSEISVTAGKWQEKAKRFRRPNAVNLIKTSQIP